MDSHLDSDLFGDYPQSPGSRGVDTSIEAAADLAPRVGRLQQLTLECVSRAGTYGRTTNEIAGIIQIERGSIQPRTSELRRLALIEDSGHRRPNANGKKAIVWVAVKGKANG